MISTTTPDRDAAISVHGLTKHYGAVEAVRGIDLDVRRGEILAVLGPNGAGKTTTVEILEGFRVPTAGRVRVLGVDPARAPRGWRARVGVVLQESQPESAATVRECLELYAGYYPRPRGVSETLELVGLADKATARTERLSGGERRRLDVALALIGNPELLFLDEPTTGFDPAARRAAWDVIEGLRDLGTTIVLTTHAMDEAERLADRIAVIAHGSIVAEGTPRTLGDRNRAAATIAFRLPEGVGVAALPTPLRLEARVEDGAVAVATTSPTRQLHALSAWALERGIELAELEVRQPSLEDVYLDLVQPEEVLA
jgi:ABC-2 type transport system ATP-binding protein